MFNYNHLYYFYLVAKLGGVTNASKKLRVAQPSLSMQIKTLEGELNLALFHKVGRRLALTPDGERAYGFCKKIFEAAEEFAEHLKTTGKVQEQRCRIGVTRDIERPFIADILSSILRTKSDQSKPLLSLLSNDHESLFEELRSGNIDALITSTKVYGQDTHILSELSMPVFAVASAHFLSQFTKKNKKGPLDVIRTNNVGLALPSGHLKLRIETDLFLQGEKIQNPIIFESDIIAAITRATIESVGVAFLPLPYISRELKANLLKCIGAPTPLWKHNIFIIVRSAKYTNSIVKEIDKHFVKLSKR